MTATRARRAVAVTATVALLAGGAALASADALLPADRTGSWLMQAGLSLSREPVRDLPMPVRAAQTLLGCPLPPEPGAVEGTDTQFATQPEGTVSTLRAAAEPETTSDLRLLPLTAAQVPADPVGDPEPADPADPVGPADPAAPAEPAEPAEPAPPGVVLLAESAAAPLGVVGEPERDDASAAPSAVQWALTRSGDVRGLSAGMCTAPAAQSWLVGGGTDVGRSTRLVLSNPGATPAVVDVVLLTGAGRQVPRAGQGVLVPPGEVAEVLVEGLAPVDPLLTVGVTSTGGPISATLVDSAVRGVSPAGVDVVTPSPAQTRHVLPGLPGGSDGAVLRIAVPDDDPAVVGWRVEGPDGPVVGSQSAATTVPGGSVVDVALDPLGSGPLSLVVESDVPVLTSVQLSRVAAQDPAADPGAQPDQDQPPGTEPAQDRAWVASAPPVSGPVLVALPGGDVGATLVLAADTDTATDTGAEADAEGTEVAVVPVSADGSTGESVRVPVLPGATAEVPAARLAGAVAVRIDPAGGTVHAAVVLTASSVPQEGGSDLVSVVAVPAAPEPPGTVVVRTAPQGQWP